MPKVKFVVEYLDVEPTSGKTVREVALENDINPNRELLRGLNCGGRGLCGTCKVWVKESAAGVTSAAGVREKIHGCGGGRRLACQCHVLGDVEVTTMPGGDDRTDRERKISLSPSAILLAEKPVEKAPEAKPVKPAAASEVKPEKTPEKVETKQESETATKPSVEANS